jgi:L-amino acid N-acyltransferase YncA
MEEIKITIAKEEDIAGINRVNKEHRTVRPICFTPADIDDKFYVLESDKRVMFVALKDNDIVGYLELYCSETSSFFNSDIEAECNIVVDPNFRRQKIGEKLLMHAIQYAKNETKIKGMRALIKKYNYASKALCKKCGFQFDRENEGGSSMKLEFFR